MKTIDRYLRHLFALFAALGLLGVSTQPVTAQALSYGCDLVNALSGASAFIGFPFNAGEVISVYVSATGGSPTQATLTIDGVPMGTTSVPGTISATVPTAGTPTVDLVADTGYVAGNWTCGLSVAEPSKEEPTDGPPAMNLLDGRVNNAQGLDVAAPVAIYDGSINVYGIDPETGAGSLDVQISDEQIEAAGVPTDAPVLLAQSKNHFTGIDIYVYRLPTGEFQINTHYADGKAYIFLWDSDGVKSHQAW